MNQTSLSCYEQIQMDGTTKTQTERILTLFLTSPEGLTRNELSNILGIRINAVAGRINELIKRGILIEEGKRVDKYSKKENNILKFKSI